MNINLKKDEVLKEFLSTPKEERYSYLIKRSRKFKEIDTKYKTDQYKIDGCQSKVWVHPDFKDGIISFDLDSEAAIIRGILTLLSEIYNYKTAEEILSLSDDYLLDSGLLASLSMTRSNGVMAVVKQIKMYAFAYKLKNKA